MSPKKLIQKIEENSHYLGFGIALLVLVLIGWNSHFSVFQLFKSSEMRTTRQSNIATIEETLVAVQQAETGQRGYLLTGKEFYLNPYLAAGPKIQKNLEKLKVAFQSSAEQLARVEDLQPLISQKMEELRKTIDLRKKRGLSEALSVVRSDLGNSLMEKIRNLCADIRETERYEAERWVNRAEISLNHSSWIIFFGSAFAFCSVLTATYLVNRDSRRRRKAEAERERFFMTSLDMLCVVGTDGFLKRVNPAFTEVLGYSEKDLLSRPYIELVHPDDFERSSKEAEKLAQGIATIFFENRWRCKNGKYKWLSWKASPEGDVVYAGARDVTRQIEVDEELKEARTKAEKASQMKSIFLANMSHEIRTPMNAIIGMSDILSETPLNEDQKRYVEIFRRASENLLVLINDILDISKIEAGDVELESAQFDLAEVAEGVVELMATRAHEKNLELILDMRDRNRAFVKGDSHRMRQVLLNLLSNAIKFTQQGQVILSIQKKSYTPDKIKFSLSITDTGIGIPSNKLNSIFKPFYQVDSSVTRRYGGTGLGLSICHQLVQLMGGKLEVESVEGSGSRFFFTLDLERGTELANASVQYPLNLKGTNALIVDDNETNRLILREHLTGWGATITEAEDGEKALNLFEKAQKEKRPFELVLLDYRMPGIDGLQVAKLIQKASAGSRVILMLLTSDRPGGDSQGSSSVPVPWVMKPLRRSDIWTALKSAYSITDQLAEKSKSNGSENVALGKDPSASSLKILLAEDSEDNRMLVLLYLKTTPYKIEIAKNGQEALEKFKLSHFDLVLMDMQMPILDGYSATRQIRAWEKENNRQPTPILALTADALKEEAEASFKAGCTAHLTKPIRKKILLDAISTYGESASPVKRAG